MTDFSVFRHFASSSPNQAGYVALATVLIIMSVLLTITTSLTLLTIDDSQSSTATLQQQEVLALAEGCIYDALLELNEDNTISTSIAVPEGSCTITIDSQSGSNWTFTVTASLDDITQQIQVSAERTNTVTVTSWQQL